MVRGTKRRGLLAYLLIHAGDAVSLDRLVEDLWDERPSSGARGTVQTYLSQLRKLLADSAVTLETRPGGYVLDVPADRLDASRFERLCAQAVTETDATRRLTRLDEALGLWRGDPLGEFAGSAWADVEATRLQALRLQALQQRVDARLKLGQHAQAIPELERLVREHSLDEHLWAQLMVAYYRSGRQAHALRAYQRARSLLADELGVEPGSEMQALERRILDHDPELIAVAPAPPRPSTDLSLPEGVVTFVLTDIEGSTPLWDTDAEAMSRAIARYEELITDVVEAHHGCVVKSRGEGDSTLSVFPRATEAAAAVLTLQRGLFAEEWPAGLRLPTRIALHTGEAYLRDGDYYGGTLNRAARIRVLASGGQVLCSRPTRDLIADALPDEMELVELGAHALRGLQRPEHVYELAIAGLPSHFPPLASLEAFPATVTLPDPSFVRADGELAGREVELQRLETAWKEAETGSRQVALVCGEPGIGKTRLAAEFAQRVHAQDAVILYGRCDEDAVVPYQPFVEALRPYVRAVSVPVLRERLHGLEHDLGRVFPELEGRLPEDAPPIEGDPGTERYRLFEAITSLLTGITVSRPTVLVLDDLQWADKPTLQLFRHLISGTPKAALLILGCYLDVEVEEDHGLVDLVADLRRHSSVTSMRLAGLSEIDSAELISAVAGRGAPAPLVSALHRETEGNPFFLEEVVRHLLETDIAVFESIGSRQIDLDRLDVPEKVREVVARRLRRLPRPVKDALGVGAVVGAEFDALVLGRASEQPTDVVLDLLDIAARAGLVHEAVDQTGRYVFAHALIRQAVYSGLGTVDRAKLHGRVGTALEESNGDQAAAALAHHFTRALPLVAVDKAIRYAIHAGHDALADLAFEDAAAHFEGALKLLDEGAPTDRAQQVELLTDLASARVYVDERAGVEAARQAIESARADGSPAQFGRAVAVFVEPTYSAGVFPTEVTNLFDEARAVLGDSEPALQARLLAYEAFKYAGYQLQGRDGRELAEAAVDLARRAGDPPILADALFALAVNLEGSSDVAARKLLGEELVRLGDDAGARARAFGLRVLARARLELGEAEALRTTTAELARIGSELRWLPALVYATHWRATQALLEGRFDDVRTSGDELRPLARAYHSALVGHTHQVFYLAREEGALARTSGMGHVTIDHFTTLYPAAALALAQVESGDEQGAVESLEQLAAVDFHRGEWESARGGALGMLAEVAATGGTAAQASALYDLLTPFAGRLLAAALGLACLGAADRYLGMLSTKLERWDDADSHFEQALTLEEQMRGRALMPRTRYWHARSLLARGDDGPAARALLGGVVEETTRLGMGRLRCQAEELLAR